MKFYDIVYKNIRGNLYRYIMYYLSNVFSVMLFFMFANFIFNPAVGSLGGSGGTLGVISEALRACEYVIIIFSFFFVSYSNSVFLKSRGREFGLLSLFGMTKGQIRKYVAYENMAVSIFSILGGIILGGLFSKLFFMAIEAALGEGPILKFMIAPEALLVTALSFFVLFQAISLFSLRRINSRTIAVQLKSTKIPKPVPKFSKKRAVLGIVLLAVGYGLAWVSNKAIVFTMLPILFLSITGTYFLFTQFSVALTLMLQGNRGFFYRKTNMIVLSQIIYKLKDNARVLFLISILGAVTLTAAGTLYAVFSTNYKSIMRELPQHISIMEQGSDRNAVYPEKIREILNNHGIKVKSEYDIEGITGTWSRSTNSGKGNMLVISCSDYNTRAESLKLNPLSLKGSGMAVFSLHISHTLTGNVPLDLNNLSFNVNGKILKGQIIESAREKVLSTNNYDYIVVLSDNTFKSLLGDTQDGKIAKYYGFDLENWRSAGGAIKAIENAIPQNSQGLFYEALADYTSVMQVSSLTMLIGLFIALLFLIATGSIIYFKMFTELQQDRAEFVSLMKMGMTKNEMKKIINTQMVIVFFLPFLVAALHSSFALKTLSDLMKQNLVAVGLSVIAIYLAFQLVYFIAINLLYKSQLKIME